MHLRLIRLACSLIHPKDVADTLNVIAGEDSLDSTSFTGRYPDFKMNLGQDIKGKKVGVPKEFFLSNNTPHTQIVWDELRRKSESLQFDIARCLCQTFLMHCKHTM